jgi:hypothetical protein
MDDAGCYRRAADCGNFGPDFDFYRIKPEAPDGNLEFKRLNIKMEIIMVRNNLSGRTKKSER